MLVPLPSYGGHWEPADAMHTDLSPAPHDLLLPVPVSLPEALIIAVARQRDGKLDDAERIYRAILAVSPEQPDALHFLGVLLFQRDRDTEAIELIERAVALMPSHADAHNNLGNVYRQAQRRDDAERSYRRAIALNPKHAAALSNLGLLLKDAEKVDEAIDVLEAARDLDPENADVLHNLGNAYRARGRHKDACIAFRHAIALRPYEFESYKYLAYTLYVMEERGEAITLLKQWLSVDPDNATARHLLAAYAAEQIPDRASATYIRQTFDDFAESFDSVLSGLRYQAPQLVAAAAASIGALPATILDAGCGTGLCGPLLKPSARWLVGVDLSPGMLDVARRRGDYDELIEADLVDYMAAAPSRFDLIVSADTLCYVGTLAPVFSAARGALTAGGALVFTLEHASEVPAGTGFILNPHGRYAHSRAAAEQALTTTGFEVLRLETVVLRQERRQDVAGLLICARRR